MMILLCSCTAFRIGIMFHACGIEIFIGWNGIMLLWRRESVTVVSEQVKESERHDG